MLRGCLHVLRRAAAQQLPPGHVDPASLASLSSAALCCGGRQLVQLQQSLLSALQLSRPYTTPSDGSTDGGKDSAGAPFRRCSTAARTSWAVLAATSCTPAAAACQCSPSRHSQLAAASSTPGACSPATCSLPHRLTAAVAPCRYHLQQQQPAALAAHRQCRLQRRRRRGRA